MLLDAQNVMYKIKWEAYQIGGGYFVYTNCRLISRRLWTLRKACDRKADSFEQINTGKLINNKSRKLWRTRIPPYPKGTGC